MILIKYLDANNILISHDLYYFTKRLIIFILNKVDEKYLTVTQFFLCQFMEIMYIIANLIYIEIIELKFCGLDYDLKKNIEKWGLVEVESEEDSKSNKSGNFIDMGNGFGINQNDFNLEEII